MTTGCPIINAKLAILISLQKLMHSFWVVLSTANPARQLPVTDVFTVRLFLLLRALIDAQTWHRHNHLLVFSLSDIFHFFYTVLSDESHLHLLQSGTRVCQGFRLSLSSSLTTWLGLLLWIILWNKLLDTHLSVDSRGNQILRPIS